VVQDKFLIPDLRGTNNIDPTLFRQASLSKVPRFIFLYFNNLFIKNSSSIHTIRQSSLPSYIKNEIHGEEKLLAHKPHKMTPQKRMDNHKNIFYFYEFLPSGEYAVIRARGAAHVKLLIREEVGLGVVVNQRGLRILKNRFFKGQFNPNRHGQG
jgi:hypothetical protein